MHSKALLDSLDAGVAAVAPDWTIVEWSSGAAEITGLPADRAIGTSFWMAFPTTKGTLVEQVLQEVRLDGRPRTYLAPARTPDFTGMVFETRVTRGPRDQLVLLFRPVRQELAPESRAAQILTALEGERLLYAQLFESLPIPALVLTVEGQILEANPEGRTLLGAVDLRALRGLPLAQWRVSRRTRCTPSWKTSRPGQARRSCCSSPWTSRAKCCCSASSWKPTGCRNWAGWCPAWRTSSTTRSRRSPRLPKFSSSTAPGPICARAPR